MNNPWSLDQVAAPSGVSVSNTGQISQSGNGQSAYPAYPNSFGLGAPVETGQVNQQAPNLASPGQVYSGDKSLTGAPGNESSRGFSPWSLTGESNARES